MQVAKDNNKRFFYDTIADRFDTLTYPYDREKRIRMVFQELLSIELKDRLILDAGCGTGAFSLRAVQGGAKVVSVDIGFHMARETARRSITANVIVGDLLNLPFKDRRFDMILCSEVIEHTMVPQKAISELSRVLKSPGSLVLTSPNKMWYFLLGVANTLKLRPYHGHENWLTPLELKEALSSNGLQVEKFIGFNIVPSFMFRSTYKLLDFFDKFRYCLAPLMFNIGVLSKRKETYE